MWNCTKEELEKISDDIKNINIVSGIQCSICMSNVTEHNIDLINSHNQNRYDEQNLKLEQSLNNLKKVIEIYNSSLLSVNSQENINIA